MMTFGRQAKLGRFLIKKRDDVIASINNGKSYFKATASSALTAEQAQFHRLAYLGASYSLFESYLLDIAEEFLHCFPEKMKNSDMKLHDALKGSNVLISEMVEKQTGQLGYKSFTNITEVVAGYFNNKPFTDPSLEIVQEFKATRDIYLHNAGRWNAIYAAKAGPRARGEPFRGPLPLDDAYLDAGVDALIAFVKAFHDHGPRQWERFNKTKAFTDMWQKSALDRLVSFNAGWEVVKGEDDLVRPKDAVLDWGWSGSEKYLLDFFLTIYSTDHPRKTSELRQALERWPAETPSGQIILSWLASPFYF